MLFVKQQATVTAISVRLQALCSDKSPRQQRVLRSWGSIGTRIGGSRVGQLVSLNAAIQCFHDVFLKKTANSWVPSVPIFFRLQRRIFLSNWNKLIPS
uniref:Poly (ADP ribose) polymerase n=1 Tax=Echinococcus granulosus TaxID=6210 RepID=A0A068X4P0_ECHGR|nr:poly (ADP ribose) polymerase [Echinococcus granulosus]